MLGGSTHIASTHLRMEELLQAQYEDQSSFPLFNGMVKVNLDLFLHQINKKYVLVNSCVSRVLIHLTDFMSDITLFCIWHLDCIFFEELSVFRSVLLKFVYVAAINCI
jgi:hypothetical protein